MATPAQQTARVITNINTALAKLKTASLVGLEAGAQEVMQDAFYRTPRKTGNLRDSRYILPHPRARKIEIGYTADYAQKIHDDLNLNLRNGEHQFLQKALKAKQARVIKLTQEYGKRGLA